MINEHVAQAFEDAAETAAVRREQLVEDVLAQHQWDCPAFEGDEVVDLEVYGPPGNLRILCVCGICGEEIFYKEEPEDNAP